MANELRVGDIRAGYLYDGDPATEAVSCVLRRDGDGIFVDIAWSKHSGRDGRRWFEGSNVLGGTSTQLPGSLVFEDSSGPVTLLKPDFRSMSENLIGGHGRGCLSVPRAVLSARGGDGFLEPHGVSTALGGLGRFVRRPLVSAGVVSSEDGHRQSTLTNPRVERISVPGHEGLVLDPSAFASVKAYDSWEFTGDWEVTTEYGDPRPWTEHVHLHAALAGLLEVAFWKRAVIMRRSIRRDDTPERTADGARHPAGWKTVIEGGNGAQTGISRTDAPLFDLSHIGVEGLSRWLTLWQEWNRALLPLSALARSEGAYLETKFAQLGLGLEALGMKIGHRKGTVTDLKQRVKVSRLLRTVYEEVRCSSDLADAKWAQETADIYNATKHIGRDAPDLVDMHRRYTESVNIFRAFIAQELGVEDAVIASHRF